MALGVAGVRVGTWTSPDGLSGCTVVLPPDGSVGAIAIRGASPGTREAAALGPGGKVTVCHAVVLAGGSAYGLASADGVMQWLEQRGIGYPVRLGVVPIVGAAIVLDQAVAVRAARPGPDAGRAACTAASEADPVEGSVGAGAGCTVAKVGGIEHCWRGGQGVSVRTYGDLAVGALVVNNAVGEVLADDGTPLAASRAPADRARFPFDADAIVPPDDVEGAHGEAAAATGRRSAPQGAADGGSRSGGPTGHTVIGCVVTNARLDKRQIHRVADLGHSGVARALRPAHTEYDGDALFCLATGEIAVNLDLVATLAADAVADACRRGPLAAVSRDGIPGLADTPG